MCANIHYIFRHYIINGVWYKCWNDDVNELTNSCSKIIFYAKWSSVGEKQLQRWKTWNMKPQNMASSITTNHFDWNHSRHFVSIESVHGCGANLNISVFNVARKKKKENFKVEVNFILLKAIRCLFNEMTFSLFAFLHIFSQNKAGNAFRLITRIFFQNASNDHKEALACCFRIA